MGGATDVCDGCPPLETLLEQYVAAGGRMLVCPICFNARRLSADSLIDAAQIGGATPLWEWIEEHATLFSY